MENFHINRRIQWGLVLFYIVFESCAGFPLWNEITPPAEKVPLLLVAFGFAGGMLAGMLPEPRTVRVLLVTAGFVGVGMAARYLLEFGEVSNTMNFTPGRTILFLAAVPCYATAVYWAICRMKRETRRKES